MNPSRLLIRAGGLADGRGFRCVPGAVLVEGGRLIAAGSPESIGHPGNCLIREFPDSVVIPALVNVHTHLDLSHIGPIAFPGDFVAWIERVQALRAPDDAEIAAAVRHGVELARTGGTAVVGDIAGAGSLVPIQAQRQTGMAGVSFLEVFGLGTRQADAVARIEAALTDCPEWEYGVAMGIQPHAPYSCGKEVYRAAAGLNRPLATHLAETQEEIEFVARAGGPFSELLKRLGRRDDSIVGTGRHPVEWLIEAVGEVPLIAAHVNYLEGRHLQALAGVPWTIAYCPRSSAYFGHERDGSKHRYLEMIRAGINVALGTDGIVCLNTPDRMSVLDEMRWLYRRDGINPVTLLRMGTINGAVGLGFDPELFTLSPGPIAGLLAVKIDPARCVEPLRQIMENTSAPEWIIGPVPAEDWWRKSTTAAALSEQ